MLGGKGDVARGKGEAAALVSLDHPLEVGRVVKGLSDAEGLTGRVASGGCSANN